MEKQIKKQRKTSVGTPRRPSKANSLLGLNRPITAKIRPMVISRSDAENRIHSPSKEGAASKSMEQNSYVGKHTPRSSNKKPMKPILFFVIFSFIIQYPDSCRAQPLYEIIFRGEINRIFPENITPVILKHR